MLDIVIIGLGYVGIPLLNRCLSKGLCCAGIDSDSKRIKQLSDGINDISEMDVSHFTKALEKKSLFLSDSYEITEKAKAIVICLPTPLTKQHDPDLSYVEKSVHSIAKYAKKGVLVILESTTYPGTTEEVVLPVLEKSLGKVGKDFYLGYSPEREDPGNPLSNFDNVPKIISGHTKACLDKALELYSRFVNRLVPVSSCATAEMTKIWENTFRAINISAVNELKMICDRMRIDVWEVIEAARTKPYGFTAFYPGPGMGGHCIPVDPFYLTWKAKEFGMHTRFIELAGEINFRMQAYVAKKVMQVLNDQHKPTKGARILVLGLAYKSNIKDLRESPAFPIIDQLISLGASVDYHDPFVPEIPDSRNYRHLAGKKSVSLSIESIQRYDACLLLTLHSGVPYDLIAKHAKCIVDTRNGMKDFSCQKNIFKA
jgi:UDP-N-acetyl-D-glucosamine dehydrogenase